MTQDEIDELRDRYCWNRMAGQPDNPNIPLHQLEMLGEIAAQVAALNQKFDKLLNILMEDRL